MEPNGFRPGPVAASFQVIGVHKAVKDVQTKPRRLVGGADRVAQEISKITHGRSW
jgi:hypothetical protein